MLFEAEKLSGLYHEVPSRSDLLMQITSSPGTLGAPTWLCRYGENSPHTLQEWYSGELVGWPRTS